MHSREIRKKFIEYFVEHGHKEVASSSLIPENDPTVLLTTAGMQQFVPYFLGKPHPLGTRLASVQKCFRTVDIDDVGDPSHGTFFEMLGNWSLGDYFKEESIAMSYELLTKVFGIAPERLSVTVFEGDDVAPLDNESIAIWEKTGIPRERIFTLPKEDNWWGPSGTTGPCGPDTEIFIDTGLPARGPDSNPGNDKKYMEIWNNVFMQYDKQTDGSYGPLALKCVDTGMGLERIAAVLQGKHTVYETDIYASLIQEIEQTFGVVYPGYTHRDNEMTPEQLTLSRRIRIIADHIRGATFLIGDGVVPSNLGRGYVLRRILRRALYNARLLGATAPLLSRFTGLVVADYAPYYPELTHRASQIADEVHMEEERFLRTIARGEEMLLSLLAASEGQRSYTLSGVDAFTLYDTYGFPLSLTLEIAKEKGVTVDIDSFHEHLDAQRERSRENSKTMFMKKETLQDFALGDVAPTLFLGYKETALPHAQVQKVFSVNEDTSCVVVDRTPFYAESGGQVGDTGYIRGEGAVYEVIDTQKTPDGHFLHLCHRQEGILEEGAQVSLEIDVERRRHIMRSHTCAHLLQAALRKVLAKDVMQKGSYVDDKRVRFDFSFPRALTVEELSAIEHAMNVQIQSGLAVEKKEMTYDEAMNYGALGLFTEKYGDTVRVIDIGDGYSVELCGGTHLDSLTDMGSVKILKESSIASGVRRIEVLCGVNAYAYYKEQDARLEQVATLLKSTPEQVQEKVQQLLTTIKDLEQRIASLEYQELLQEADRLLTQTKDDVVIASSSVEARHFRTLASLLVEKKGQKVVFLSHPEGQFVLATDADHDARLLLKKLSETFPQLSGGGSPRLVQGKGATADLHTKISPALFLG